MDPGSWTFPACRLQRSWPVALVVYLVTRPRGTASLLVAVLSAVALGWQVWMILPYTALWPQQMVAAEACNPGAARALSHGECPARTTGAPAAFWRSSKKPIPTSFFSPRSISGGRASWPGWKTRTPHTILEPLSNTYGMGPLFPVPAERRRDPLHSG